MATSAIYTGIKNNTEIKILSKTIIYEHKKRYPERLVPYSGHIVEKLSASKLISQKLQTDI